MNRFNSNTRERHSAFVHERDADVERDEPQDEKGKDAQWLHDNVGAGASLHTPYEPR